MELDNTGFFVKMREHTISCSGIIGDYGYVRTEPPKPSNCVRCGAPVMSYQTDCEYCGKNLKEKINHNRISPGVSG